MAIDFATETSLRALSPALAPLSSEATQLQIVSAITSASGGVALASEVTAQSIDTHVQQLLTDAQLRATPVGVAVTSSALPTGAATEATLDSIKDTDGIKKITDALPAGTNTIGGVTQATSPWIIGASEYGTTAFGEFRVSNPKTLIDIINKYGRDPEFTATSTSGGGTVTDVTAQSVFKLSVGATNGDYAKVRTHDWLRYQTGRGQHIILTVIHEDDGQTNQTRNWGYFDDNNGLGFRLKGTTLYVFRRTATGEGGGSVGSPYEEEVASASWNENTYGSLDITKGNIYEIRFQWLGVGMVKFFINGVLVHSMDHPNTLAYPYIGTGTLPLTWEVINTAASTASSMSAICGHVTSQSGQEVTRLPWSLIGSPYTTAGAGEFPLLSFRMKQTVNSVDNRIATFPGAINVDNTATTAGANALIYARLNPTTLTGATWAGVVSTESAMEYDSAATVVSGGSIIDKFIVPALESVTSDSVEKIYKTITNRFGRDAYTGVSDIITISVQRISANNPTVTPEFFWGEER